MDKIRRFIGSFFVSSYAFCISQPFDMRKIAELSKSRTLFYMEVKDENTFSLVPRKYANHDGYIDASLQLLRDLNVIIPTITFTIDERTVSTANVIVPRPWLSMLMDLLGESNVEPDLKLLDDEPKLLMDPNPEIETALAKCKVEEIIDQFRINYSGQRPFRVLDPDWASVDGFYFGKSLVSDFAAWCRTRHSLQYRLQSAAAAEGGFGLASCPGYRLAYEFGQCESRSDVRGKRDYRGRRLTPYWGMVALREAIFDYGIATKSDDDSGFWNPSLDE